MAMASTTEWIDTTSPSVPAARERRCLQFSSKRIRRLHNGVVVVARSLRLCEQVSDAGGH